MAWGGATVLYYIMLYDSMSCAVILYSILYDITLYNVLCLTIFRSGGRVGGWPRGAVGRSAAKTFTASRKVYEGCFLESNDLIQILELNICMMISCRKPL